MSASLTLLKNAADVYCPVKSGYRHVLLAGTCIVGLLTDEKAAEFVTLTSCLHVQDVKGCVIVPGIIDMHVHMTGGGGEAGPASRCPEARLSDFLDAGITTAVGVYTDTTTRSQEHLVAKCRGLTARGMTCYHWCGGYAGPCPTATGSIQRDMCLIDSCMGVGNLANVASQARLGGMLSGKFGLVYCHMGAAKQGLQPLMDAVAMSDGAELISHVEQMRLSRHENIQATRHSTGSLHSGIRRFWLLAGLCKQGRLLSYEVADLGAIFRFLVTMVKVDVWELSEVLQFMTANPARVLQLPHKGQIAAGKDADLLLLDQDSLELKSVMLRGCLCARQNGFERGVPLRNFPRLSDARISSYNEWVCGQPSSPPRVGFAHDIDMEMHQVQADIDRMQTQLELFVNSSAVGSEYSQLHAIEAGHLASPRTTHTHHITAPQNQLALQPFLFVGVLSVAGNAGRRTALRETWMATAPSSVVVRFVLYEKERDIDVQRESDQFQDIIFVQGGTTTDYRSIVYKTFAFIQWVTMNAEPKFVLKTDDDAYVSCAALVEVLQGLCHHPNCLNERLYFGQEKRHGVVITEEDSKWSNLEYFQLTGLKEYVPYMLGGGYAFSFDVAQTLHKMNSISPLKLMPNEDATFGFWVMGLQLRHVAHPKVRAAAGGCCFYMLPEEDATGPSRHVQIRTMQDVCSGWLILHKVETEGQMAYLHHRLNQCPHENMLLEKARQTGKQAGRPAAPTAPHKVMPLQVAMVTDSRTLHHYWSHTDVSPWSADGSLMLSQRADVSGVQDLLEGTRTRLHQDIGFTNFTTGSSLSTEMTGWNWTHLTTSSAWNLQLGSRLQWLGPSNRLIIFNDHNCHQPVVDIARRLLMSQDVQEAFEANSIAAEKRYMRSVHAEASHSKAGSHADPAAQTREQPEDLCSVVFDIVTRQRLHVVPCAIYTVSPDGKQALSFDFGRSEVVQAGSGYSHMHSTISPSKLSRQPKDNGLWLIDIDTKNAKLLISIHELSQQLYRGAFSWSRDPATGLAYNTTTGEYWSNPQHCFGHISAAVFNAEGSSIAFKYHASLCSPTLFHSNHTYIMTMDTSGSNLWRVPLVSGHPAGMDYGSNGNLIISENSTTYLVTVGKTVQKLNKPSSIAQTEAGPCKFHPHNNRYVVCDSIESPRKLYVWDLEGGTAFTVGTLVEANWPSPETGRSSLQAHFTPDGQYISFDSSHIWETGIQTYIAGLQHLPIPHPDPYQSTTGNVEAALIPLATASVSTSLPEHANTPMEVLHDVAPPVDEHSPNSRQSKAQLNIPNVPQFNQFESTSGQQVGRNVYIMLTPHDGSAIDSFLSRIADPSEWEVYVLQAPMTSEGKFGTDGFNVIKQWQGEVNQLVMLPQAAGISETNITVAASGSSVYDVSMADLAHVLLPHLETVQQPRFAQRTPEWLQKQRSSWLELQVQQAYCTLTPAACEAKPLKLIADLIVDRGSTQDVQTMDFPAWLGNNTAPSDNVIVQMDLGEGREFEMLQSLLLSDRLTLIDHLLVQWHYQAKNWHLALLWEYLLAIVGVKVTVM
ncbi:hypothetical protein WJX77_003320 [Trebouxia sp. C0004]